MYLVITKLNEKIICNTADEVKNFNKKEDIMKIFSLSMVDYNEIVSTSDIRDCIYNTLKGGNQLDKNTLIESVQNKLGISKSSISKVIAAMKKENIIYVVEDDGWLGVD